MYESLEIRAGWLDDLPPAVAAHAELQHDRFGGVLRKHAVLHEEALHEFEPGARYDEPTVNAIVARVFPDHAAIRRYLVDGGFLSRDRGEYWRSGGRVDLG